MSKHSFSVLNYGPAQDQPFLSQNKEWAFFGDDNAYPYYLEDLYVNSAINSAIVKGIGDMIYGEGLDSPDKDAHVDQWLLLQSLFKKDCLKKAAHDLKLYGNAYFQVIWSADRSVPAETNHIPAAYIRCGKADDQDEVKTYYYSPNWADVNRGKIEPQPIPAFSTDDRTAASHLIHIKVYSPVDFYYGIPDYVGSTKYIELDKNIAEYHLASIKNGLFPSMMISFNNGMPTNDERVEMERAIEAKFSGAENAGRMLIVYNDDKENAPTVEPFNIPDPHRLYDYLSKEVSLKVLSGHRVTSPLLFGLRGDTGFGSNADEMRDAYDLLLKTVVFPFQEILLAGIRPVLSAASITLPLHFKKLIPASFMDDEKKNSLNLGRSASVLHQVKCG